MASNFMITSQNNIEIGEENNKIQCASMYSQIDCGLKYFNLSIQISNNTIVNDNVIEIQNIIENELITVLNKAKETGWNIFDNINEKLNKK